jgi:ribonuclease H-related protein
MPPKPKKYYAYFVADKDVKGVTDRWGECEKMVKGVKSARFKGFSSRTEAEEWLRAGADYDYKRYSEAGIYFDAGTGRGNGVEIKVTDENGAGLLEKVLPKSHITRFDTHGLFGATNNFGELLACKYALQIAIMDGVKKVFGDSKLVIEYWSKGYVKQQEVGSATVRLARETAELRKKFEETGGTMTLISGDDNPADLGFHR